MRLACLFSPWQLGHTQTPRSSFVVVMDPCDQELYHLQAHMVQLWYLLTGNTDMQTTETTRPGHVEHDEQQKELHTAHSVLQQG
jgi:hypothetical protein